MEDDYNSSLFLETASEENRGEERFGVELSFTPQYLISKDRVWLQSVKSVHQTINKLEVKSTEKKADGVVLSFTPRYLITRISQVYEINY